MVNVVSVLFGIKFYHAHRNKKGGLKYYGFNEETKE